MRDEWDEILSPEDARVLLEDGPNTGIDGRYGPEIRDPDDEESAFPSEVDHILEQVDEAQYGPGGQPLGQVDQAWKLRELEREDENRRAPNVCTNPASWDQGVLGNTVTVNPGNPTTVAGPLVQVAHWMGENREVRSVAVTIQPQSPFFESGPGSTTILSYAVIEWGVHGAKFRVEVDVGAGVQVSLGSASSVIVSVGLEANSTAAIVVSGGIGFDEATRTQPVFRTSRINGQAAANTTSVARPMHSATLLFERDDVSAQYTLNFIDTANSLRYVRTVASGNFVTEPIPLASDIVRVNVINEGTGAGDCRLMWGIF